MNNVVYVVPVRNGILVIGNIAEARHLPIWDIFPAKLITRLRAILLQLLCDPFR